MTARRRGTEAHATGEALDALVAGIAVPDGVSAHVRRCALCQRRVEELRALRGLLQASAGREVAPGQDLAGKALARLRWRQGAAGDLNELFAGLATLLRGLATLLPGSPRERGD